MDATREQYLAMAADRHLVVSASAGSGKTTVLVQRYVRLILSGVDVRHIVAITFTRKAAAEMLARVTETVERQLAAEDRPAEMRKLKDIRERLTGARVSTIHSFCGRLLRDFPIEADVHPNFTEQSQTDAALMRRDAAENAIIQYLTDEDTKPETARIFHGLGRATLQGFVEVILADKEKLISLRGFYAQSNEQCLRNAEDFAIKIILPLVQQTVAAIGELLEGLRGALLTTKQAEAISKTTANFFYIKEMLEGQVNRRTLGQLLGLLSNDALPIFKKDGELQKKFAEKCDALLLRFSIAVQEGFGQLSKLIELVGNREADAIMIEFGRTLYGIAEVAAAEIEEQKRKSGELDFDDLQLKALELLQNEDVCRKIRRKLRYLMIDEFQDTNELQYRIAKQLISALGAEEHSTESPNIYVVGDAKQSIYGFRGADVRVFGQARDDINQANQLAEKAGVLPPIVNIADGIQPDERERYGDVRITASFRLSPVVAAFVNKVCGNVMPTESEGYEVGYDRMICARKGDRIENDHSSVTFLIARKRPKAAGEIETSREDSEETIDNSSEKEDDNRNEAEMLARHIHSIVKGVEPLMITSGRNEEVRPVRFSDIAILMRSRSNIEQLTTALRRENVPFLVYSGAGFYRTQEIEDIRSYLSFLHNPDDDIALAATLHSPFFNVSDAGLFVISQRDIYSSLWEKLLKYTPIEGFAADEFILRARRILQELLPLAPRLTIPTLIRRILEISGWNGIIATHDRTSQMEANVEKLIGIAREFEHKGFRNLYDFVEELATLGSAEAKESEAAILTTEDVVNVMTIHAAKGLEFPVVALYNSNSRTGNNSSGIELTSQFGASFEPPIILEGYTVRQPAFLSQAAQLLRRKAEKAEEKRLLYVALTRAKDHLIISASLKSKKNGQEEDFTAHQGFFDLIMKGTELDNDALIFTHIENSLIEEKMPFLIHGEVVTKSCLIPLTVSVKVEREEFGDEGIVKQHSFPRLLMNELLTEERDTLFSASQLMLFEQDETEYIFRYRLGMPDDNAFMLTAPGYSAGEEDDAIMGSFAGTIIHEALAVMPEWLHSDQQLEHIARNIIERKDRSAPPELLRRVMQECRSVSSTALLGKYKQSILTGKYEYSLQMPVGQDILMGTMDLLIQDAEGQWEIWDWKTNRVRNARDIDKLRDFYKRQLQVYAVMTAGLFPHQEFFTTRLLFTRQAHAGATNDVWSRSFRWSKTEIKSIGNEIVELIRRIKSLM